MLQYSMTNKVSLTRRCCSRAEKLHKHDDIPCNSSLRFVGGSPVLAWRRRLSVPVPNLTETTELFSTRRHSVCVIACVLSSVLPAASLRYVRPTSEQLFLIYFREHLPPVATPGQDTFILSVHGCLPAAN